MAAFKEFAKPIGRPARLEFSDIRSTQHTLEDWLVDPNLVSYHYEPENQADRLTSVNGNPFKCKACNSMERFAQL